MHEYRPVLRPVPRFEPPARPYPNESDRVFVVPERSYAGPRGVTDGRTGFPPQEAQDVTPAASVAEVPPGTEAQRNGCEPVARENGGSGSVVTGEDGPGPARTGRGGPAPAEPPRERARPRRTAGSDASSNGRSGNDPDTVACPGGVPRDPRRSRTGVVPDRGVPQGVRQVLRAGHTAAVADAREYAWCVLRIVLEVLDRRRPVAQLARFASPAVQAAVSTLVSGDRLRHRELGTAVLARVHAIGTDEGAVEVCGTYQRGSRHFAIAARIARTRTSGWRLTALRV